MNRASARFLNQTGQKNQIRKTPKPMPATAAQKSTQNVKRNLNDLYKVTDRMWAIAKDAPMFSVKKVNPKTGKESKKYTRLINTMAYQIAVSGACNAVSQDVKREMKSMGMTPEEESKTRPWTCALAPGAAFMLEQFLAAIVQQVMFQAKTIRTGIKKHSRNHKSLIKLAIDDVRESVFHAASGMPTSTTVLPISISRKKKEGEVEAPGDKEMTTAQDDDDKENEEGEEEEEEEEEEQE